MSRILVLFGTTDGHTAKVARVLSDALQAHGAEVDLVNSAAHGLLPTPDAYDGVVVAGSLHVSSVQRSVRRWVKRNAASLVARPNAFVLVCLGVLQQEEAVQRDVVRIRERFFSHVGWHPDVVRTVAGAIPYTRYSVLKRFIMRRIASKTGGGTDTSRDYEYTDWDDLRAFASEFLARVPGGAALAGSAAPA